LRRWARNILLLTAFKTAEFLFGLLLLSCLEMLLDRGFASVHESIATAISIITTYYLFSGYWFVTLASIGLASVLASRRAHLATANAGSFFISGIALMTLIPRPFLVSTGATWLLILAFDAVLPFSIPPLEGGTS